MRVRDPLGKRPRSNAIMHFIGFRSQPSIRDLNSQTNTAKVLRQLEDGGRPICCGRCRRRFAHTGASTAWSRTSDCLPQAVLSYEKPSALASESSCVKGRRYQCDESLGTGERLPLKFRAGISSCSFRFGSDRASPSGAPYSTPESQLISCALLYIAKYESLPLTSSPSFKSRHLSTVVT